MPLTHNPKGRARFGPPFLQLHKYLLRSPAWRALSPVGRAAYVETAALYNGSNNGTLAMSARVLAALLRSSKDTAATALRELQDKGFIEVVRGGSFQWKIRHATEYRLTNYSCDATNTRATKAFMRWIENTERGPKFAERRSESRDTRNNVAGDGKLTRTDDQLSGPNAVRH